MTIFVKLHVDIALVHDCSVDGLGQHYSGWVDVRMRDYARFFAISARMSYTLQKPFHRAFWKPSLIMSIATAQLHTKVVISIRRTTIMMDELFRHSHICFPRDLICLAAANVEANGKPAYLSQYVIGWYDYACQSTSKFIFAHSLMQLCSSNTSWTNKADRTTCASVGIQEQTCSLRSRLPGPRRWS